MSINTEARIITQTEKNEGDAVSSQFNQNAASQLDHAAEQIEAMKAALRKAPNNLLDRAAESREKLATVHAQQLQKLAEKNGLAKQKILDSANELESKIATAESDIAKLNQATKQEADDFASALQKDMYLAKRELESFSESFAEDLEEKREVLKANIAEKKAEVKGKIERKREKRKMDELEHRAKKAEENAEESIVNVLHALLEADFACMVALEAQSELDEARKVNQAL